MNLGINSYPWSEHRAQVRSDPTRLNDSRPRNLRGKSGLRRLPQTSILFCLLKADPQISTDYTDSWARQRRWV